MRQTWRWFGPKDVTSVQDMMQSGVQGVVSALHHIPTGDIWHPEDIAQRQREISQTAAGSPSGLAWEVVESLPVSEDIKKQRGDWRTHVENYKASLANLAAAGIQVVCYNFMPVIDWTRTDLRWKVAHGGSCMRFDMVDFAMFDLFLLERSAAREEFAPAIFGQAQERFANTTDGRKVELVSAICEGLPGSTESLSLQSVREHLAEYDNISPEQLRSNLIDFLAQIVPTAEKLGVRLCCHPDDPPFSLMGLPRIMSTEADYKAVTDAVDSPSNGITLCSGSLGARPDNDLLGMMERLGHKVHFLHLRNVKRDSNEVGTSFYEAEHLGGDVDMVALIAQVLREEKRRKDEGRADHQIPMRPDHGQDILDDLTKTAQPGYPTIGRMRGLAEIRGVMQAFEHKELGLFQ